MKKILFTLSTILAVNAVAESWIHRHTFSNDILTAIAYTGDEYICMPFSFGNTNYIHRSHNLDTWSNFTVSVDDELYQTTWNSVDFQLRGLATQNGKLISILHKQEFPSMGNIYAGSLVSMVSTNGMQWVSPTNILNAQMTDKVIVTQTKDELSLIAGEIYDSVPMVQIPCHRAQYNESENAWETTAYLFDADGGAYTYFSDNENTYLSYRSTWLTNVYKTICFDGDREIVLGDYYLSTAIAHNGIILGNSKVYSPGAYWEDSTALLNNVDSIIFNGHRMAGVLNGNTLGISDDFGQTWQTTYIGELNSASIIEVNNEFIALTLVTPNLSPATSSIYTIDAYPERTIITEIQGFGTASAGLHFQSASNGLYQLECTANLISPDWKSYGVPKVGTGGEITVDPVGNLTSNIFFRVRAINN